jgi:outer membrane protein assembly factor BamB
LRDVSFDRSIMQNCARFRSALAQLALALSVAGLSGCDEAELFANGSKVAEIRVTPEVIVLRQGQQMPINVELFDENGVPLPGTGVSFASVDTLVMTVTQSGVVRANSGSGSTQIIVAAQGRARSIQVSAKQVLTRIALIGSPATLSQLDSVQLEARAIDAAGHVIPGVGVSFSVPESDIAEVTHTGLVRSAGPAGDVHLSLSATHDGRTVSATAGIAVTPVAARIKGVPSVLTVPEGSSSVLNPTILDRKGDVMPSPSLKLTSADTTLVRTTDDGVIYSVGSQGTTTVTVQSDTVIREVSVWVVAYSASEWNVIGSMQTPDVSDVAIASTGPFLVGRRQGPPSLGNWRELGRPRELTGAPPASAVAFSPDGRTSYFSTAKGGVVAFDIASNRARWATEAAPGATALAVSRDGDVLYMSAATKGVVAVRTADGEVLWRGPASWNGVSSMELLESRGVLLLRREGVLSEVNLATRAIRDVPWTLTSGVIRATPDGTELWTTLPGGNALQVLRASDLTPLRRIQLPCTPSDIAHARDGRESYVSCVAGIGGGGGLLVMEKRGSLLARIVRLPGSPSRIALSPEGRMLLVSNGMGRVDVLR